MTGTVVAVVTTVKPLWPASTAISAKSSDDLKTLLEVLDTTSAALLR
jgi:hypothetical protein